MTRGKPAVRVVEERPFNAETPIAALAGRVVPNELFYVRNHFDVPELFVDEWRLTVDGAVAEPLELGMEDLRRHPESTLAVTMECAGNGRALMDPLPPGMGWAYGAVSTARFTGVSLRLVLDEARLVPDAMEVVFTGADRGRAEPGRVISYAYSISVEQALRSNTLLVWAMNDDPLSPDHGFPLRLVVPGVYGMASVKWLTQVRVVTSPFAGYFPAEYRYVDEPGSSQGHPVAAMRVKAVIARPEHGAVLPLAPFVVAGTAWSGSGSITRVEVSPDGGNTWSDADLDAPSSQYAANPWRFLWTPRGPGSYMLAVKATDEAGHSQPLESSWNAHGYGNNEVHRIEVEIRE